MSLESKAKTTEEVRRHYLGLDEKWVPLEEAQKEITLAKLRANISC